MLHPLIVKESSLSVAEVAERLQQILQTKKIQIFTRISHSQAAYENNLILNDVELFIFGDPKVGTYLMQECPAIGIELPLKILIWQQNSKTFIGYRDPKELLIAYDINKQQEIIKKMSAMMAALLNEL